MLNDSLKHLRDSIEGSVDISDEEKRELLSQCGQVQAELEQLSKTHKEEADSIAGYAAMRAKHSVSQKKNDTLIDISSEGLNESLREFQSSHPALMTSVDLIFRSLSRLGI